MNSGEGHSRLGANTGDPDPFAGEFSQIVSEALRRSFDHSWQFDYHPAYIAMTPRRVVPPPSGRQLDHAGIAEMFELIHSRAGIGPDRPLPVNWGRETDLLVSAAQGLDPWLKHGGETPWRDGFIAQPVVRHVSISPGSELTDGMLSSFVNASSIGKITSVDDHVARLDVWLDSLSSIGVHVGRLAMKTYLQPWSRGEVRGISTFITLDGTEFSDASLLWNVLSPDRKGSDIGLGLERLRWIVSKEGWHESVFGVDVSPVHAYHRDAIRTAVLLSMHGVRPSSSGAGAALRKVLTRIPRDQARNGLGRAVRAERGYWTMFGIGGPTWDAVSMMLEDEVMRPAKRN